MDPFSPPHNKRLWNTGLDFKAILIFSQPSRDNVFVLDIKCCIKDLILSQKNVPDFPPPFISKIVCKGGGGTLENMGHFCSVSKKYEFF